MTFLDKDDGPVARFFWFGLVPLVAFLVLWSWQPWVGSAATFDEEACRADIRANRTLDDDCMEFWALGVTIDGYESRR